MTNFTAEQIVAAKDNDIDAVAAVIAETEALVTQRANDYAKRGGRIDRDLADDLAQAGRIRIWECLAKFEGDTPASSCPILTRPCIRQCLNNAG